MPVTQQMKLLRLPRDAITFEQVTFEKVHCKTSISENIAESFEVRSYRRLGTDNLVGITECFHMLTWKKQELAESIRSRKKYKTCNL